MNISTDVALDFCLTLGGRERERVGERETLPTIRESGVGNVGLYLSVISGCPAGRATGCLGKVPAASLYAGHSRRRSTADRGRPGPLAWILPIAESFTTWTSRVAG